MARTPSRTVAAPPVTEDWFLTFDLIVWPVDRAISVADALAEAERFGGRPSFLGGHDKRLDPFIAAIEQRYPGIRDGRGDVPCEFDVLRDHIFLGIPWSNVEGLIDVVASIAWRTGVAVFDPQRETVGLPAPFAEAPMGSDGVDDHIATAEGALDAIAGGAAVAAGEDDATVQRSPSAGLRAAGYRTNSPLGFEITPDIEDEVRADPTGMPASLSRRPTAGAALIADLTSVDVGARHRAITQLAGWDADPEVATALRELLPSDDVFEASQAATGLARQGDITELPALVALIHRMSPTDGGTLEAMCAVLPPGLDLARRAGPVALDGLKARVRDWRGGLSREGATVAGRGLPRDRGAARGPVAGLGFNDPRAVRAARGGAADARSPPTMRKVGPFAQAPRLPALSMARTRNR